MEPRVKDSLANFLKGFSFCFRAYRQLVVRSMLNIIFFIRVFFFFLYLFLFLLVLVVVLVLSGSGSGSGLG